MTAFAFSLLVSYGIGYAACRLVWPPASRNVYASALMACISFGAGIGLTSCMYFWWLASGAYTRGFVPFIVFEVFVLLALYAAAGKKGERARRAPGRPLARAAGTILLFCFVIAAAASVVSFMMFSAAMPHGEWDAYSIWNQHARFMSGQPELWTGMFDAALSRSHPDYPLMLPASVARCWEYIGSAQPFAAQGIAFLFMFFITATAVSATALLKGKMQGMLCGLAVLSASHLVQYGAFQYADMPLGYFILASVAAYIAYRETGRDRRLLLLAGLLAALAAWTKNEGVVFFVMFALLLFMAEAWRGQFKRGAAGIAWFLCGSLPVILTLVYFKARFAPQNDLIAFASLAASGQDGGVVGRLLDPARYSFIAGSLINYSYFGGFVGKAGIILYLIAVGIDIKKGQMKSLVFVSAVFAGMAAVYCMIFLMSPQDLNWYVFFSMGRILGQLLPVLLLAFFIAARSADDILSAGINKENI